MTPIHAAIVAVVAVPVIIAGMAAVALLRPRSVTLTTEEPQV